MILRQQLDINPYKAGRIVDCVSCNLFRNCNIIINQRKKKKKTKFTKKRNIQQCESVSLRDLKEKRKSLTNVHNQQT